MLLLFKCFDIKKVKSLNDLVIIDWLLGGEPTKKTKKTLVSCWHTLVLLAPL